ASYRAVPPAARVAATATAKAARSVVGATATRARSEKVTRPTRTSAGRPRANADAARRAVSSPSAIEPLVSRTTTTVRAGGAAPVRAPVAGVPVGTTAVASAGTPSTVTRRDAGSSAAAPVAVTTNDSWEPSSRTSPSRPA